MINIVQILKQCCVDGFVKRVRRTLEIGSTVYLLAEARDGRWIYIEKAPDGFDALFRDTEAEAMSHAPTIVQRGWAS